MSKCENQTNQQTPQLRGVCAAAASWKENPGSCWPSQQTLWWNLGCGSADIFWCNHGIKKVVMCVVRCCEFDVMLLPRIHSQEGVACCSVCKLSSQAGPVRCKFKIANSPWRTLPNCSWLSEHVAFANVSGSMGLAVQAFPVNTLQPVATCCNVLQMQGASEVLVPLSKAWLPPCPDSFWSLPSTSSGQGRKHLKSAILLRVSTFLFLFFAFIANACSVWMWGTGKKSCRTKQMRMKWSPPTSLPHCMKVVRRLEVPRNVHRPFWCENVLFPWPKHNHRPSTWLPQREHGPRIEIAVGQTQPSKYHFEQDQPARQDSHFA